MKRTIPSERTKEAIKELLSQGSEAEDPKSTLVRLAVKRIVEEALEASAQDILGRGYYERGDGEGGYRNGYRRGRLKISEGPVDYEVPQVRNVSPERLQDLKRLLSGRSEELEGLGLEMFARGCSTRDIEAIFRGEDGKSLLSRTAVSEVTEALWKEYEEFATRDLSEIRPLYLFLDGIAEKLRPGAKREAVLSAWCLTWDKTKVLIHASPGSKESTECCREFLEEMKRRGLEDPVLVVTDGAPGLIRAVEESFPSSLRQRCLAHRMRNLMDKLPEEIRGEFKAAASAAYQAPSVALARSLRKDLVERFGDQQPTAVRCFEEDFEACIAQLHCPPSHRRTIRTTNLLERLFLEERRRTKAAGTLFGEKPVLKLMYASLIRASERWRGISITEFERRQLERLKDQLKEKHRRENKINAPKQGSTPQTIYSKKGT